jgi:copper(I)-binding protein
MHKPWLAFLCLFILASCTDAPVNPIAITEAKVRAAIPGSDKSVGYFVFKNSTPDTVELVRAQSSQVRAIEFHQTFSDAGGMSRMRRLKTVVVESGTSVSFEPGGRHLMLFGVTELESPVIIEFSTASGATIIGEFKVVSPFTD